ncbi:hypothetical protein MVES1_000740 [Malassezia vespertilionis]|uniref:uncharacterized protein n=1 Tax=Malassezia vespertilionis TaxID=2020962 RepID=UPI0024B059DC|nr:uncharacterized protein MVES1_000740 [Malassezia vespertilionis]WFD05410.1 hypothetical protein MVES1_000740 [Malassezia vespertilionis]
MSAVPEEPSVLHFADKKQGHDSKRDQNETLFSTREAVLKEAGEDNNKLEHSVNVQLANPLLGLSFENIQSDVDKFVTEKGLEEYRDLFLKGALCIQAQSTGDFESISLLTDEDRADLLYEKEHRWSQPFLLYWLACCCSVAAAVQGADESVINGALLFFPQQFGIGGTTDRDNWLQGLVAAAPYIACAFCGVWLTKPLNVVFGRRGTIFITSFVSFATCIWQGVTNSWEHLFVSRLILGLGIGPKSATVPVYAAECTPAPIRGALTMQWQTWTAFGIMLGYAADLALFKVKDPNNGNGNIHGLNWRLMLGSAGIPALFVMAQVYLCPESPRWLMGKNKYRKAMNSFLRLRTKPLFAARDLYLAHCMLVEENNMRKTKNNIFPFMELFTVPRNLRATIGATIVMFGQQFCGVNVIAYYSSSIITDARRMVVGDNITSKDNMNALLGSWGFGMINFLFAIPAWYTIDTFGRRSLLLLTLPFMAIFLLITGFSFWIDYYSGRLGVVLFGIYFYAMFYSPGFGPVPFTYCAEAFPLYIREVGMTYATAVLWFFNSLLAVTWFAMRGAMTSQGAFGFYAGWCVILWILTFLFLPETKALTLEELDLVFSIPTTKFAGYQLRQLPYYFKRYVLFNKSIKKEQLYTIDSTFKSSK